MNFDSPSKYPSVKAALLKACKIKAEHRTDLALSDWRKAGFAKLDLQAELGETEETVRRVSGAISAKDFEAEFEATSTPVILTGLTDEWPAKAKWRIDSIATHYGEAKFKVGESDDGTSLRMRLDEFLLYLQHTTDDSPLYLFESDFSERKCQRGLAADFTPPPVF